MKSNDFASDFALGSTNEHTEFFGVHLNIIDHNGKKWLTAEQAGLALGYSEDNARISTMNLYGRNKDEFTEQDSTVINLITVDGKARNARIFSATGCNLLSFFSSTKRAKQFRAWAKQALANQTVSVAFLQEQILLLEHTVYKQATLMDDLKDAVISQNRRWQKIFGYACKGLNSTEIGKLIDLSPRQTRHILQQMRQLELMPHQQRAALPYQPSLLEG